ncbi:MAG: metal-dependent hydrolase [Candidatus Bathyarchaeia archaeon]
MDLPTHWVFGIAIGLLFFGHPEIALLIGLGALIPDLDREYWFIPATQYRDEQLHRALFHNVFIMALAYLVSPFLSLGVFLHALLDSFTTVKDRGCEWFYPVTRLVKRGRKDANGNDEPLDPTEHVYFYQEDPKGLLENPDPDLRKLGDRPVPWRRTYGPALNSQLLDRGFLFGSSAIIGTHLAILLAYFPQFDRYLGVGYMAIVIIFVAGELGRRYRAKLLRVPGPTGTGTWYGDFMKILILVVGIILGCYFVLLSLTGILRNLEAIVTDWVSILLVVLVVALLCPILAKWQTRDEGIATV